MEEFESNENNLIIGEHVVIKERSQLLSIEYEQLQKIKSLRIENQIIDEKLWYKITSTDKLKSLYFLNCNIDTDILYLCDVPYVSNIGFIKCGLTSEKLDEIFHSLPSYSYMDILDLSENKLGQNPKLLIEIIEDWFRVVKHFKTLILFDNGFDKNSILDIKRRCERFIDKIII